MASYMAYTPHSCDRMGYIQGYLITTWIGNSQKIDDANPRCGSKTEFGLFLQTWLMAWITTERVIPFFKHT